MSRTSIASIFFLLLSLLLSSASPAATTSATYGATLSWTIPTQRQNGQVLAASELSGYEIYYTTDDPAVAGSIKVSGGTTNSYAVSNLTAGNYYFAISALDTASVKSPLSSVVAVTLGAATVTTVATTTASGASTSAASTASTSTSGTSTTGSTAAAATISTATTSTTAVTATTTAGSSTTTSSTAAASTSVATYSAKLSWTIPTMRANGQALSPSELSGYEISYVLGGVAGTNVVKVSGGTTSSYVLSGLKKGIYGFNVTAIDANGLRSAASARFLTGVGYTASTTASTTTAAATGG